jgi:ABC-2 type transport system permease protein
MLIGRFILAFNGFVAIFFLFTGFTQMKGYTYSDILLCFSVIQISFSIAECLGSGFKAFSGIIKQGEFDRILLRPCSPILQVLGTKFDLGRLGPILTAIITLIIGIRKSHIDWSFGRVLILLFMIMGGAILFIGLFMLGASFCFFSIEDAGIMNVLTYGAKEHGKYPIDIYGKGLMRFCTYVIPYTLIQYYPLQYLLGRSDRWQYVFYPFGTLIFLGLCYFIWIMGLRNYKSTGN